MPFPEERLYGTSNVIAQVRVAGDQTPQVRIIDGPVAGVKTSDIMIRFGRLLIYIEDYEALQSLILATRKAIELAPEVFPQARAARRPR